MEHFKGLCGFIFNIFTAFSMDIWKEYLETRAKYIDRFGVINLLTKIYQIQVILHFYRRSYIFLL